MYAPNATEYTYSSSPEDNDCGDGGSVLSSSLFNRIDTLGGARAVDVSPPLMTSGGGIIVNPAQQAGRQNEDKMSSMTSSLVNMNSKPSPFFQVDDEVAPNPSAFAFAPVAPEGPSLIGSTLSSIIASHKSAHQQQGGYGQLLEQYGYNHEPPERLTSGGLTSTTATASGNSTSNNTSVTSSSNNVGENGHDASASSNNSGTEQDEDLGRRQYQEIMSTHTSLPTTNGHHPNESSVAIGGEDQNQQWKDLDLGTSSPAPAPAAPSSSFQQQPRNEGGEGNASPVAPVSSSSLWPSNNNEGNDNRPMVFHGKGSFPLNLALMLETVERPWTYDEPGVTIPGSDEGKMNHIVSWLSCGSGFVIHQTDLFLSEVLPRFFKSSKNTKLRSFYRKLNRWGFSVLRSSQLNQEGTISTIKNAWQHPDFVRERAVECLVRAQKSGDTDYSHMLSVTHVSFGEGGSNGGRDTPGSSGGGGKKRSASKRGSDYSIESTVTAGSEHRRSFMDMDTAMNNEFNSSFPTLDRRVSNKRRGSCQDTSQRMSWSAGAPLPSFQVNQSWTMGSGGGVGVSAANNAATSQLYNQQLKQSWTAGSNSIPNTAVSKPQMPPFQPNQSWTAGGNPLNNAAQLNQSWTAGSNPLNNSAQLNQSSWAASGFTPNNASQLSHIQFNQLMNNQISNNATATNDSSNGYNEWKNMVMQSNEHSGGSPFGQAHQQNQQVWGNGSNTSASQSNTNGNSYGSPVPPPAVQPQEQQWSQSHQQQRHQHQQCQLNGFQQQQQQQPQGNEEGYGQQEEDGELTQEDIDLRMFFERFAEQMGGDDK